MAGRIGLEGRQVDDGEVGHVIGKLALLGADQQVADEQRMPGIFREDPGLDPVGRIGAAVEVLREQLLALGMGEEVLQQGVEMAGRDGAVVVPPDGAFRGLVAHHELVLGRAARMHAGLGQKRAALHELGLAPGQGLLVERGRLEIPVDPLEVAEAGGLGALRAVEDADIFHGRLLLIAGHRAAGWAAVRWPSDG